MESVQNYRNQPEMKSRVSRLFGDGEIFYVIEFEHPTDRNTVVLTNDQFESLRDQIEETRSNLTTQTVETFVASESVSDAEIQAIADEGVRKLRGATERYLNLNSGPEINLQSLSYWERIARRGHPAGTITN
jgi:predicted Fe-Mo cluster-binding NifX family protein